MTSSTIGTETALDRTAFASLVAEGTILGDGGTGTSLVAKGIDPDACFDALNISAREVVREVHESFVQSGAQVVETNTFGANRYKLAQHGIRELLQEINVAGVARAREAGARIVAGSVGPLGVRLAPYGRVPAAEAREAFAEQIGALAQGGADVIMLETHSDLTELCVALEAARDVCDLPVIASLTFTRDDRTLLGETPAVAAKRLVELGADAIGVNCSEGPDQVLRVILAMRRHTNGVPLVSIPNAGAPQRLGDRIMFSAAPDYLADYAVRFRDAGVWLIGGCCGSSPAHVRAMARALSSPVARPAVALTEEAQDAADDASRSDEAPSVLARTLAARQFVIAVEMEPPKGSSAARLIAGAQTLRDAGATVINVADTPRARMRMSAWAACYLVQQEAGIESVLNFPTRGRNLLRIQGDLLAAYALGIRNMFAVMGDPTSIGDFPEAADLQDVTPSGLIALVKGSLNEGIDRGGSSIGEGTSFVVGCAVNLNAEDQHREARVLHRKITAGADFALSQPIYDPSRLEKFRVTYEGTYGPLTLPILVGLLPVVSARHAAFLHNEVPGIDIPEDVRARIGSATDERAEGLAIAAELGAAIRGRAAGIYLIPPFRRYDLAAEFVERLRMG